MPRHGQRITLWLPDVLMEYIDERRSWRTRTEFLRDLVAASMDGANLSAPLPEAASVNIEEKRDTKPKDLHDPALTWQELRDRAKPYFDENGFSYGRGYEAHEQDDFWRDYRRSWPMKGVVDDLANYEANKKPAV